MIMIGVGILIILIYVCYCYWGPVVPQPPTEEAFGQEQEQQPVNTPELGDDPMEAIKTTHGNCPVRGGPTTLSTCVHYPELNKAFIISVCSENCVSEIQSSLNGGGEFTIQEMNGMNVLHKNNVPVQATPLCSEENMDMITQLVGTQALTE